MIGADVVEASLHRFVPVVRLTNGELLSLREDGLGR